MLRRGPREEAIATRPALTRVSERALQDAVLDLLDQRQVDRAARTLIDQLPAMVASGINVKEKLATLLFLARSIGDAGGGKYGVAKFRTKVRSLTGGVQHLPLPPGGFVELGCGAHDPLALSVYFFLNGLAPAWGVDLLPPRTPVFSALSMYDILANVRMFPARYCWRGNKPRDILERLRLIDVAAFEAGDFGQGVASMEGAVRLFAGDIRTADITPGSIALLSSFAVLEHVDDIDAIHARVFALLAPGGIAYHFADLADHRSYRGDGAFGPLAFLTEAEAPANMNRLRAPEIAGAALRAGFEIVDDKRTAAELTAATRAELQPRFAAMADADVAVIKQHIVLRKPG